MWFWIELLLKKPNNNTNTLKLEKPKKLPKSVKKKLTTDEKTLYNLMKKRQLE
jgi:hypothetical protein